MKITKRLEKRGSSKKSSVEMERKRSSSVGRMSTTIDVIRASTKFLSHQSEDTAKHYGKVRHVKILPSVVKVRLANCYRIYLPTKIYSLFSYDVCAFTAQDGKRRIECN